MKAWVLLIMLVASATLLPQVQAHSCGGGSDCVCPVPDDGAAHAHAGPGGSCTNGANATPGGASAPGVGLMAILVGVALVAALVTRRRD